jgi:hypothetical protein
MVTLDQPMKSHGRSVRHAKQEQDGRSGVACIPPASARPPALGGLHRFVVKEQREQLVRERQPAASSARFDRDLD